MIGHYQSPLGKIVFITHQNCLTELYFGDSITFDKEPFHQKIMENLDHYFKHQLTEFHLPLAFEGTEFQKKVWNELLKIPYGHTRSYQDIAVRIGQPKASQAVGQACKKNPIGIIIPCHRVIGKNGQMTGYSGKKYIHLKEQLIEHEKNEVSKK